MVSGARRSALAADEVSEAVGGDRGGVGVRLRELTRRRHGSDAWVETQDLVAELHAVDVAAEQMRLVAEHNCTGMRQGRWELTHDVDAAGRRVETLDRCRVGPVRGGDAAEQVDRLPQDCDGWIADRTGGVATFVNEMPSVVATTSPTMFAPS